VNQLWALELNILRPVVLTVRQRTLKGANLPTIIFGQKEKL
jgi:hypothetical protein